MYDLGNFVQLVITPSDQLLDSQRDWVEECELYLLTIKCFLNELNEGLFIDLGSPY